VALRDQTIGRHEFLNGFPNSKAVWPLFKMLNLRISTMSKTWKCQSTAGTCPWKW
jgi:hypothetical protein